MMRTALLLLLLAVAALVAQNPAVTANRIIRGFGAPASATCNSLSEVSNVYVELDSESTASPLYICTQTSAGMYGWVLSGTGGAAGTCGSAAATEILFSSNCTGNPDLTYNNQDVLSLRYLDNVFLQLTSASNGGSFVNIRSSGGTLAAPTDSSPGDGLGELVAWGYAGDWRNLAGFTATMGTVNGVASTAKFDMHADTSTGAVSILLDGDAELIQESHPVEMLRVTAPGNATAGYLRLFANNGTGQVECLDQSGGNCLAQTGTHEIEFTLDGGGSAITTGQYQLGQSGDIGACTITGWSLMGQEASGSITIELDAQANTAPPDVPVAPDTTTDKISASAPMQITTAQAASSGTAGVSTWTTSRASWDTYAINVTAVTTFTRVTGVVWCR